jgi:hypothetical protein
MVEIAYVGGSYVVSATKPSYLTSIVSLVAACLTQGATSPKSSSF